MSLIFTAVVDLCRAAESARVIASELRITVVSTVETRSLAARILQGDWPASLYVGGKELTTGADRLADGDTFAVVIEGVDRAEGTFANNVSSLLGMSRGAYLVAAPAKFFLIRENFRSGEKASDPDVAAYFRALRIGSILRNLADASRDREDSVQELIFFSGRKLVLPIAFDSASLARIVDDEKVDSFEEAALRGEHADARREIVKRSIVRACDSIPSEDRFGYVLRALETLRQSFLSDYEVYSASFNSERAREDFERKKLDYVVKAGSVTGDVMTRLIAIPVGQALLVSQIKRDPDFEVANTALAFGSLAFTLIGILLVVNQVTSLQQISRELANEIKALKDLTPKTYDSLRDVIGALKLRLCVHLWVTPVVIVGLLVFSTVFTAKVYFASKGAAEQQAMVLPVHLR